MLPLVNALFTGFGMTEVHGSDTFPATLVKSTCDKGGHPEIQKTMNNQQFYCANLINVFD